MTLLCDIGYKYGTDKCPQIKHFYTEVYFDLFKDKRDSVKKVVEVGIGFPECMSQYYQKYVTGASLYMWRDFFPNAQIYGADIEPKTMFEDEQIKTFLCDQRNKQDVEKLIQIVGTDIDLFIDDGAHYVTDQEFLCKTVLPLLKDDAIYVIEDVRSTSLLVQLLKDYDCTVPIPPGYIAWCAKHKSKRKRYRNSMIVVRKRK